MPYIIRTQYRVSPQVTLVVKLLPANAGDMRFRFEPWVGEIPLQKGMAIHSSILARRIPWTEGYSPWDRKEWDTTDTT